MLCVVAIAEARSEVVEVYRREDSVGNGQCLSQFQERLETTQVPLTCGVLVGHQHS